MLESSALSKRVVDLAADTHGYGIDERLETGGRSQAAHDHSLFDLNAKYVDGISLEETLRQSLKEGKIS